MSRKVTVTHHGVFTSGQSEYRLSLVGAAVDDVISYTEYLISAYIYSEDTFAYIGGGVVTSENDRDRNIAIILNDHPDDELRITVSVVHRVSTDGGRWMLDTSLLDDPQ